MRASLAVFWLLANAGADWIDIPEFSDHRKVYRPMFHTNRRIYDTDFREHKLHFRKEPNVRNYSFADEQQPIMTITTQSIIVDDIEISNEDEEEEEGGDDDRTHQFDVPETSSTTTTESSSTTTSSTPKETNCLRNDTDDNDKGFLDYLPVDLLKRVHKTLKSQPSTLRGKILFLKVFERTLIDEIESRLSAALAPSRVPRGARDHDDHEEGIGFPSLEGTLMAISFLTFAVYLVRLVMMLFRNAGNTGAPPIFIGRKKRSLDDFTEETARILSYLDSGLKRHFHQ